RSKEYQGSPWVDLLHLALYIVHGIDFCVDHSAIGREDDPEIEQHSTYKHEDNVPFLQRLKEHNKAFGSQEGDDQKAIIVVARTRGWPVRKGNDGISNDKRQQYRGQTSFPPFHSLWCRGKKCHKRQNGKSRERPCQQFDKISGAVLPHP